MLGFFLGRPILHIPKPQTLRVQPAGNMYIGLFGRGGGGQKHIRGPSWQVHQTKIRCIGVYIRPSLWKLHPSGKPSPSQTPLPACELEPKFLASRLIAAKVLPFIFKF